MLSHVTHLTTQEFNAHGDHLLDPMMSSTFTQSLLNVATNKLALQLTPPEASIVEASALG